MSYIDDKITKDDFLDRIYKKSKSENTRHSAEIALRNLDLFCQHTFQKDMDTVIDDLISIDNSRKTFAFFQKFVDFLQQDHPDILFNASHTNARRISFKAKMPSSIRAYVTKSRKYAKMRGLSVDIENFVDNVFLPTIDEELDPEPFTHDEIRLVCNHVTINRKILYMSIKDSGAWTVN